jgi:hypothetical protein
MPELCFQIAQVVSALAAIIAILLSIKALNASRKSLDLMRESLLLSRRTYSIDKLSAPEVMMVRQLLRDWQADLDEICKIWNNGQFDSLSKIGPDQPEKLIDRKIYKECPFWVREILMEAANCYWQAVQASRSCSEVKSSLSDRTEMALGEVFEMRSLILERLEYLEEIQPFRSCPDVLPDYKFMPHDERQ